jgi:uncharacterized membrane protein YfcA
MAVFGKSKHHIWRSFSQKFRINHKKAKLQLMTLQYWYVFPISILFATTAMASGVEGATFFSPLFILALKLSPEVAIGTALTTEVFGFASGPLPMPANV